MYDILLFYKYTHILDPQSFAKAQRELQARLRLTGRTIVASEGLNVTLEGTSENVDEYLRVFLADPRFANTHIKRSPGTGSAFPKLSVKVRSEIVALGLGVCDIDPNVMTGTHLSPEELHAWFRQGREFYIVDMRNAYEHEVGRFTGSVCPPMENFRDLPKFVKSLEHLKNKTVLTVCTGGVRCEKASGYLLSQGFTDVFQLDGGIVSYMEKYPNEDFEGKLYVFDNRIHIGFYTDDPKHKVIGRCVGCGSLSERFTNCTLDVCHRQMIVCESCEQAEPVRCKVPCRDRFSIAAGV
ncbi:MAG TPA: rhodanese-related sulfurtransferase [Patescibacteria group bacterium]|nr:rhodanese-related sulfurtransferase [Patescibacteria group bacterium]